VQLSAGRACARCYAASTAAPSDGATTRVCWFNPSPRNLSPRNLSTPLGTCVRYTCSETRAARGGAVRDHHPPKAE
jgi:hypothetical protein